MCSFLLRAETILGSGEFGVVFKGSWEAPYGLQEVAIKMLKKGSTDKQMATFLQEAAIMAQFRHPHIVRLLGAVTVDEPVSDGIACMVALLAVSLVHMSYITMCCVTMNNIRQSSSPNVSFHADVDGTCQHFEQTL